MFVFVQSKNKSLGAFFWDDADKDLHSKITQIMVYQRNLGKDSSIPLMRQDPSNLRSLVLIWIIPKKYTLSLVVIIGYQSNRDINMPPHPSPPKPMGPRHWLVDLPQGAGLWHGWLFLGWGIYIIYWRCGGEFEQVVSKSWCS